MERGTRPGLPGHRWKPVRGLGRAEGRRPRHPPHRDAGLVTWRGRDEPGTRSRLADGGRMSADGADDDRPPFLDGVAPVGSLTGGLLARLRSTAARPTVTGADGAVAEGVAFAATVERAAAGLGQRGMCPDDIIGVLAPVCPERLTAVYTVMAMGGLALPL